MRVLNPSNQRNTGVVEARRLATAGDTIYQMDDFLHSDEGKAGRVGGEDRGYTPNDPNHGRGGGSYLREEPDALSAAGRRNTPGFREGERYDPPSNGFRPATPGTIGGTEPSDYVIKRAVENGSAIVERVSEPVRKSSVSFKDIMVKPTQDGYTQGKDYLGSIEEAK